MLDEIRAVLQNVGVILPIRIYGDPILRQACKPVESITPEMTALAQDMLETMYAAGAVGLAAPQVGYLTKLIVLDVRSSKRPSSLWIDGKAASLDSVLPLALVNVAIKPGLEIEIGPERCNSVPGIRVDIERPESAEVFGTDTKGRHISFRCGGLLARAVQHEHDHLNGILFTDRMSPQVFASVRDHIQMLERETQTKEAQNG